MYTLMLGVMPFPFTSFLHRTFWRLAMWYKWYQNYVAKAFEYWRMGQWIVVESLALPVSSCVKYSKHHSQAWSNALVERMSTWRQAERNCLLMLKPSNHQSKTVEVGTFYAEMVPTHPRKVLWNWMVNLHMCQTIRLECLFKLHKHRIPWKYM